jgi:hypothetical protein
MVYNLPIVLDIDGEYALLLKLGNWVLHAHYVINVLARPPPRKKSKFERAYDRRQAKYDAASERRIEGRALRTQRCATCGRTDHSRRSSKLCLDYQPRRAMLTPLKRTSVIKASLENSCGSADLIDQIRIVVLKHRTITYIGSLFAQFCIIERLADGQPCPILEHNFCYHLFAIVCGLRPRAEPWLIQIVR